MPLTQQYFDEKFENIDKKFEQVDLRFREVDKKFFKMEQVFDQKLAAQSKDMKNYIKVENTHLVVMIQEKIIEPMEERFEALESKVSSDTPGKWIKVAKH